MCLFASLATILTASIVKASSLVATYHVSWGAIFSTLRDFNFRSAETLSTFTQWKQAAEC